MPFIAYDGFEKSEPSLFSVHAFRFIADNKLTAVGSAFLLNLNNKFILLENRLVLFYKSLDNLQSPLQLIHGPRRTGGQPDGGKRCGIPHSKAVGAEHLHAMVLCLDFKMIAAAA